MSGLRRSSLRGMTMIEVIVAMAIVAGDTARAGKGKAGWTQFGGPRQDFKVDDAKDLDDAIMEMIEYDGPVLFDCLVEKHENCFPMIPSGAAHNDMLLGEASTADAIQGQGAVLV